MAKRRREYCAVLGLLPGASDDEIKAAYRKLALQFHPDRNKDSGAEARFKEISEAYAVLSDDQKRQQYDAYGHAGFDQMYTREDIFRTADFSDFEDLFGQFGMGGPFAGAFGSMFGQAFRRGGRMREYGADLGVEIQVTLEEAARGVKKDLGYHRSKACPTCNGSGAEPGTSKRTCSACNGRGQVQQSRRAGPMAFYTVTTCSKCGGEGSSYEKPCRKCGGNGKVSEYEHIKVNVPAGIDSGMRIHLDGMGEFGRDGPGDLYVTVYVAEHKLFQRREDDLWLDAPITFAQAALGGEIEVPTLFGKARLHIPAGTSSHTVFRLKGEGMPRMRRGGKGDEMVRAIIEVPKKLSARQKELLKKLDEEEKTDKKGLFGI